MRSCDSPVTASPATACHDSRMTGLLERLKAFLERYLRPEDSLLEVLGGVIVVLATVNTLVVTRDRAGVDHFWRASFTVAHRLGVGGCRARALRHGLSPQVSGADVRAVRETDEAGGLAIISGRLRR